MYRLMRRGFRVDRRGACVVVGRDGMKNELEFSGERMDAGQRLVYGLCKKYGIDTTGMSPAEAWAALKEKTGKTAGDYFGEVRGGDERWSNRKGSGVSVKGPKASKKFVDRYLAKHPRVKRTIGKYADVMDKVRDFKKNNPDAEDGTYDAVTGKPVEFDSGYSVTFHQNLTAEDTLGGYDRNTYAKMCAVAVHKLRSESVYVGYFDNPEISFHCESLEQAMKFAVEHNQHSIWDWKNQRIIKNPYYSKEMNPVK